MANNGKRSIHPSQGEETRKLPWVTVEKKVWYFHTPEDAEAFAVAAAKAKCISPFKVGAKVPSHKNGA